MLETSLKQLLDAITDSNLTYLKVCDNAISTVAAPALNHFMMTNTSLKNLQISNCGLGAGGTKILVDSLLQNQSIQIETLVISRNRFYAEGVTHLARFFKEQTHLKHLDVSYNNVNIGNSADDAEDMKAEPNAGGFNDLFPSLAKSAQSLSYLNITGNNISDIDQVEEHKEHVKAKREGLTQA